MGLDKAVLETGEAGIRKIRTNYETTMIFTFEKLAKAYVLYRISLFKKKIENFAD